MTEDHPWLNSDPDDLWTSERLPLVDLPAAESPAPETGLAEEILAGGETGRPDRSPLKRFVGRVLMIVGGVLALGVVLYTVDLMTTAGDVPRGVVVAGVDVGGLSHDAAEAKLRRELQPRLIQPVPIFAGDVQATLDPASAGLGLDWASTLAHAGHQSFDPFARIRSFFVKRSVDVVTTTDQQALDQAISQLAVERLDHPPTEGNIGFQPIPGSDGRVTAHAIEPRDGQTLSDVPAAADLIKNRWLDKRGVWLVPDYKPVLATSSGVHATLDGFVAPAIAQPVVVQGDGGDALLKPDAIAAAMVFTAHPDGTLAVSLDSAKLQGSLSPQLAGTEKPGKDAQIVFVAGNPTVEPAEDARKIDWDATLAPLTSVLIKTDARDLAVRYRSSPPELTTADLGALNVDEVVGEFTTGELSGAAATNVRNMADRVNGMVLRPGQVFSLIDRAGSWDGFVSAPLNEDGTGPQVVGGGVSQFATTLYNAAYLAGLADAGHTEHSYYLDRYPPGRDAIALRDDGSHVDLRFTNSLASGVMIQAFSDGSSVTVRIWGRRQYRVDSVTSQWRDIVAPPVVRQSGSGCQSSPGQSGFAVTDSRVRYDVATGVEVGRDVQVVRYAPQSAVVCT